MSAAMCFGCAVWVTSNMGCAALHRSDTADLTAPLVCLSRHFSGISTKSSSTLNYADALLQERKRAEQKGDWGGINKFLNRLLVRWPQNTEL